MTAQVIDGKKIAAALAESLAQETAALQAKGIYPRLVSLEIGNDPAGTVYARNQQRMCEKAGIRYTLESIPESATEMELISRIEELNLDRSVSGILLQMPVPESLNASRLQSQISVYKDVEGVHPANMGLVLEGEAALAPCTAMAVMHLVDQLDLELKGQNVTIVGHSEIVGKPLSMLFLDQLATPTVCHIGTRDLAAHTRRADILVVAVGKPGLISANMVKPGAVVVDVGINTVTTSDASKKILGDVDFEAVSKVASWITPVPGGVGPVTVAMLGRNVLEAARRNRGRLVGQQGDEWVQNILQGYGYPPNPELAGLISRILNHHLVKISPQTHQDEALHHGLVRDLSRRVLVADGAVGTLLHEKGFGFDLCYESLNLSHPQVVEEIHKAYVDTGCDLIQTNTFGANRYRLEQRGFGKDLREINIRGVELARRAAGGNAYVAGSIGPLDLKPEDRFKHEQIKDIYVEQAFALSEGGIDCFVIETMRDLQEVASALEAVREVSQLPVICQLARLSAEADDLEKFVNICHTHKVDVIGVNCGEGPLQMLSLLKRLARLTDRKLSAQPNAGLPRKVAGRVMYGLTPHEVREFSIQFYEAGVNLMGGCCGIHPELIRTMVQTVKFKRPKPRERVTQ